MGLFQSFDICATGLTAQRFRMDVIAENIANVSTTRTADGDAYRRKMVTFQEKTTHPTFGSYLKNSYSTYGGKFHGNGVKVVKVSEDFETDYVMEYDPSHPDADENGYVSYPNVNTVQEMTDLIDAARSYEANTTAFNAMKSMATNALSIGGGS